MTAETPLPALDLLVVGGLTIDRFADGSSAPGGTAVHVARAAARGGMRLGVVTSVGPEPEAALGLAELREHTGFLNSTQHAVTPTFRHQEGPSGRRLWLERVGGPVLLQASDASRFTTRAVLYAPIAGEIELDSLDALSSSLPRAAILQGWLRPTEEGVEIRPLSLGTLDPGVAAALGGFDLLVASREDLVADGTEPGEQLTALRDTVGARPALVVTNSVDGLWLDVAGQREHVPAPWIVRDAPTVGAGDILAAFLIVPSADPAEDWVRRAADAMRVVAEDLEARKRS